MSSDKESTLDQMSMIKVLEQKVADKIAAGEVIDRPVSIVKELVENSLDAGATSIVVELKGGGREYIRVTDDGCGMAAEDVETAFMRHATSKIHTEDDLDAIKTLGFRGEALASICAVSHVDMITRRPDDETGRHVVCEAGSIIENKPSGCPSGTTITVRDLFFNIPARLKFLASDSAESRRIIDMMSRIAMSYPDVRFRVINGGKDAFTTSGRGNILENILRIYGRDLEKDLIAVDYEEKDCVLRGFVSSPSLSSSSRNRQFFCVNGRVVSSKVMEKGLEKAYKQRLFAGRFPLAFLFLSIPANTLDVNVHPTKKEIRFDDPFFVEDLIEKAVKASLMGSDSVPEASGPGKHHVHGSAGTSTRTVPQIERSEPLDKTYSENNKMEIDSNNGGVDIKNVLETMRQEVHEKQLSFTPDRSLKSEDHRDRLDIEGMDLIGVVLDTYIITTLDDSMYLIDQHAAHERILFEDFLRQYHSENIQSQVLLVPFQITVSADLCALEVLWMGHLEKMGYDVSLFGDRVYIVRQIPAFLGEKEAEEFIRSFFIDLEDKPDAGDFASLEGLIMRSCRSAVKGGDRLHSQETRALLKQLSRCDNPYSCPHGRPVIVRMSRRDLEKMFKRV